MSFIEIFLIGVGLSMDALAVSICKGLATGKVSAKHMCLAGAWFGGFQMLMPLVGYLLGYSFERFITSFDHWIAFVLLALIGAKMIKEALADDEGGEDDASFDVKTMFLMAVATSIDALAVGITFAFLQVSIISAVLIIGATTFVLSAAGVKIGSVFGAKYKSRAGLAGGIILILIGLKILLEHLGILTL